MNIFKNVWFEKIKNFEKKIKYFTNIQIFGYIESVNNFSLSATGLFLPIGSFCAVECFRKNKLSIVICKIIGFKKGKNFLVPLDNLEGIFPGSKVFSLNTLSNTFGIGKKLPFGYSLLGRVIDSFSRPLDGLGLIKSSIYKEINRNTINPMKRIKITKIFDTGIKLINGFLTVGSGQRIGIFSRPGVGKSTLLGMIARYSCVDIIIIALSGERGREVKEFVQNILGIKRLKKSIIIAETADAPAFCRMQSVIYATSLAEYFCQDKKKVLLIVDSLTRYAMAYRDLSLSMNEIPISKGYPASIFSNILELIERTGNISEKGGSITAFYTILTEGDNFNDPILDIAKSVLDGHIMLSNKLSNSGLYPAIDIEKSISRSMFSIIDSQHYEYVFFLKKLISCYNSNKDLINLGAYTIGSNLLLDQSIKLWPFLKQFSNQKCTEKFSYKDSVLGLKKLFEMF